MKIIKVLFREINIPLKFTFSQSNNLSSVKSSSVILEFVTEDGISGFGECCPRPYVTGETIESVQKDLARIAGSIASKPCGSLSELKELLNEISGWKIGPSTLCAVELALLDLLSKALQRTLPDIMGINLPALLEYSLVLPLLSPTKLDQLAQKISFFKPKSIKIKVDSNTDQHLENLSIIRSVFGSDIPVRVDVNGGWTIEQAKAFIPVYLENGINSFEQPLPSNELESTQLLTGEFGNTASIMMDESLLKFTDAQNMIKNKIGNHFNLKVSKLGGLFKTQAIIKLADENGIPCQLGAHFGETSLLSAAGLLVSGMTGTLTALEGALGSFLLERDLVEEPIQQDLYGMLNPQKYFQNPGLVKEVLIDNVDACSSNKIIFPT